MSRDEMYDYRPSSGYIGTYIWYNGALVELISANGTISIPTGRWSSIPYNEDLDGKILSKKQALAKYPEWFV